MGYEMQNACRKNRTQGGICLSQSKYRRPHISNLTYHAIPAASQTDGYITFCRTISTVALSSEFRDGKHSIFDLGYQYRAISNINW